MSVRFFLASNDLWNKLPKYDILYSILSFYLATFCNYEPRRSELCLAEVNSILDLQIRGCIQKFQDWPLGARTANDRAL